MEGLRKLLTAPVAQARSALRRLGVTVTLELEPVEPWITNAFFKIGGTFEGLADEIVGALVYEQTDPAQGEPTPSGRVRDSGAGRGNRTPTGLRPPDFESGASA